MAREKTGHELASGSGTLASLAGAVGGAGSADAPGAAARFNEPVGVAVDQWGNVYVADSGNATIRKITPSAVVSTLAGAAGQVGRVDGRGAAARFNKPFSVAVDGSGNVYVADTGSSTIRKIKPSGMVTTLAGRAGQRGQTDGRGGAARFDKPFSVAADGSGNVYVADTGNSTVRKISPSGVVSTLAGRAGSRGSADGPGAKAQFNGLFGVAADRVGSVWVADTDNNIVRKISPSGVVSTIAGSYSGSADGPGSYARFHAPTGVAVDSAGNLYLADAENNTVRKIAPSGVVSTVAGTADQTGSADGSSAAARFDDPHGVTVDEAGNLYLADTQNNTIRKIAPSGMVSTLAGTAMERGYADGPGAAARFNGPKGLAVDGSGNIYVADTLNSTIRKVTPSGVAITLAGIAGQGGGADGRGSAARFNGPEGVAVDGSGNIYVADTANSTIRKITPSGVVSTVAGVALERGSADGRGSAARFNGPEGVAVDRSGNIYVADTANSTVRKITPSGVVSTFAGAPLARGSVDGPVAAARFDGPESVAIDRSGNIYVSEWWNNTIRLITPGGVVRTLVGGTRGRFGNCFGPLPASLVVPYGLAVDQVTGTLYVTVNSGVLVVSSLTIKEGNGDAVIVPPRGQQLFTASGGSDVGAWSLSTNNSGGSITRGGLYTAGAVAGTDTATVTDSQGAHAAIAVTVAPRLAITTDSREGARVAMGGQLGLMALGGDGPYTWSLSVNNSGGSISQAGVFRAGTIGNVADTVKVTDSAGYSATMAVFVSRTRR
ncbi:MAG TPA: hypothetical protein VMK12_30215 [Anaeromyxobacteraceae bacterium]|nr:hypothetical protein [Anaeromyxobacteraceae bacterium]